MNKIWEAIKILIVFAVYFIVINILWNTVAIPFGLPSLDYLQSTAGVVLPYLITWPISVLFRKKKPDNVSVSLIEEE